MAIHFGKRIKELVELKGLTRALLAQKLEMTENNVYKIFNKENVDTELLVKVSEIIDEPVTIFFGDNVNNGERQYVFPGEGNLAIGDHSSGQYFHAKKIMNEKITQDEGKVTSNEKLHNDLVSYKEKVEDLERLVKSKDETIASLNKLIEHLTKGK
jgi:transcriptional regulator with XRE-family HTH domain